MSTKPDNATGVDTGNPIAAGLQFYGPFNPTLLDLVEMNAATIINPASGNTILMDGGTSWESNNESDGGIHWPPNAALEAALSDIDEFTIMFYGELDSGQNNAGIVNIPWDYQTWASPFRKLSLQHLADFDEKSGNYTDTNGVFQQGQPSQAVPMNGARVSIIVTRNGTVLNYYVNGALDSESPVFITGNLQGLNAGGDVSEVFLLSRNEAATALGINGRVAVAAIWNRELSAGEAASLNTDPYQLALVVSGPTINSVTPAEPASGEQGVIVNVSNAGDGSGLSDVTYDGVSLGTIVSWDGDGDIVINFWEVPNLPAGGTLNFYTDYDLVVIDSLGVESPPVSVQTGKDPLYSEPYTIVTNDLGTEGIHDNDNAGAGAVGEDGYGIWNPQEPGDITEADKGQYREIAYPAVFTYQLYDGVWSDQVQETFNAPAPELPPVWSSIPGQSFGVGDVVSLDLNNYTTGDQPITFSVVSGPLPAGLSLDPVSGVISGTVTDVEQVNNTYGAQNAAGGPVTSGGVTWTITQPLAPPVSVGQVPDQFVPVKYPITPIEMDLYFVGETSYAVDVLPAGLSMDPAGVISGVAESLETALISIITGSNAAGDAFQGIQWDVYSQAGINAPASLVLDLPTGEDSIPRDDQQILDWLDSAVALNDDGASPAGVTNDWDTVGTIGAGSYPVRFTSISNLGVTTHADRSIIVAEASIEQAFVQQYDDDPRSRGRRRH